MDNEIKDNETNNLSLSATPDKNRLHYAWVIVLVLSLIQFGDMGIFANSAGVFVQPVTDELGFSRGGFSLYFSIVCVVMTLTMPLAHKIMSSVNVRIVIPCVIIVECLAFGLMSQYHTLTGWYISAVMLGLGQAYLTYLFIPFMINNWFKTKYGTALGIASSCSTLGGALMVPLAGYIIANYGWRNAYIALALIAFVITFPVAVILLRAKPADKGLLPYGADQPETNAAELSQGWSFKKAIRSPYFYLCLLFTICLTFACNFINQFTAFAYTLGFPVEKGAMITSLVMISGVVADLITGYLKDKFGTRVSLSAMLSLGIIGLILLLNGKAAIGFVLAGAVLWGFGFALLNTAANILTRTTFGPKEFSRIFSYIAIGLGLTSAVAQYVYGLIYDLTGGYFWGLIFGLIGFIIALIVIFILTAKKEQFE